MKRLFLASLATGLLMGCSSPRGGTSNTDNMVYGQGSSGPVYRGPAYDPGTDFGRGGDRFNQDSSRLLPGKEPDAQIYR